MALSQELREEIESRLINMIYSKLETYEPETPSMPFQNRLLGGKRVVNFSLVQSVNTKLGMSFYEQIAEKIARSNPAVSCVVHQYELVGKVNAETIVKIDQMLHDLRNKTQEPNKASEIEEIFESMSLSNLTEPRKFKVDLYVKMNDGVEYYFELKTPKPNLTDAYKFKRQLLEWLAVRMSQDSGITSSNNLLSKVKTVIAMPYNPYAPRPYDRWTSSGIFEPHEDLLAGDEFWDLLGGQGTYQDLLDVFEQTGLKIFHDVDYRIDQIVASNR